MWIAGLDALRKPLLHLHTQANVDAAVGDHRHGLHEPQPGRARRPRVRLHPDPAGRRPQDRRRPRQRPGASPQRVGDWARAARGARGHRARMRLARFGDNMRDVAVTEGDKVEAELRFGVSVNTYGVNDLVDGRRRGRPTPTSTRWSPSTPDLYDVAPELRRGGDRHESLRYGARDRARPARVPRPTAASARSPRTSRTSAACASCPGLAVQRLMADGYGFGGEGDWKTVGPAAHAQGRWARAARRHVLHGGLHLPPRSRARRRSSAPTCSRSARRSPRRRRRLEIHPLGIGGARTRCGWCSTPTPGPAWSLGIADMGDRFRLVANEVEVVAPDEPLPKLPVARAVWRPAPDLRTSAEALADRRRPAPHRADHGAGHRAPAGLRRDRRAPSWSSSTHDTDIRQLHPASCAGTRRTTAWPRASEPAARRTTRWDEPRPMTHQEGTLNEEVRIRIRSSGARLQPRRLQQWHAKRPQRRSVGRRLGRGSRLRPPATRAPSAWPCRPSPRSAGSRTATTSRPQLEAAGYKVDLQYAEDDIPTQVSQVENMVTKGDQDAGHRRHRRHRARRHAEHGRGVQHPGHRLRPADP